LVGLVPTLKCGLQLVSESLIKLLTLHFIRQNSVCIGNRLESLLGSGPGVHVWMIAASKNAIRAPNLCQCGGGGDPKRFVMVFESLLAILYHVDFTLVLLLVMRPLSVRHGAQI
jgi:hypothetical protein